MQTYTRFRQLNTAPYPGALVPSKDGDESKGAASDVSIEPRAPGEW